MACDRLNDAVGEVHHLLIERSRIDIGINTARAIIQSGIGRLVGTRGDHGCDDIHVGQLCGQRLQRGITIIVVRLIIGISQDKGKPVGIAAPAHEIVVGHIAQSVHYRFRPIASARGIDALQNADNRIDVRYPVRAGEGMHDGLLALRNIAVFNN